jgi:uncharacterized protein YjbI with pentapeptide repeats
MNDEEMWVVPPLEPAAPEGFASWVEYWTAHDMPWRKEPEIAPARQREFARRRSVPPERLADVEPGCGPFQGLALNRADLEWLLATRAVDQHAELRCADLREVDVRGLDFSGLDLSGSDFTEARLSGCMLRDVVLWRALLIQADLRGADLTGARLFEADCTSADLRGAVLRGVDLDSACLENASLAGADLRDARLVRTQLNMANFDGADVRGADLTDADTLGASLAGANLHGAKGKPKTKKAGDKQRRDG